MIDDRERIAAAVWVEKMNQWRITMLPGILLNARQTDMLVAGPDKAEPVKIIFDGPFDSKSIRRRLLRERPATATGSSMPPLPA